MAAPPEKRRRPGDDARPLVESTIAPRNDHRDHTDRESRSQSREDLDTPTFPDAGRWAATLYPGASEGTVVPRARGRQAFDPRARAAGRHERDAAARAQARVRRYAVANELSRFVTVTFEDEPASREEAAAAVQRSLRRLRGRGPRFPWLRIIEGDGHTERLHAHLMLPGLSHRAVEEAWSLGTVDIQVMRTVLERRRVAMYVSKKFDERVGAGRHRYQVARGFEPEAIRWFAEEPEQGVDELVEAMGREPETIWTGDGHPIPVTKLWWNSDEPGPG